jgi:hypothetical protein
MEGRSVEHNFERDPSKDHPCQVWFNLVQGFQRRRFKCESLDIRQMPSDGKNCNYMAMSSLTYIPGFSVRIFQPVYSV